MANYSSRFPLNILEIRSMLTMSDLFYARCRTFARLSASVSLATRSRPEHLGIASATPDIVALGKAWVAIRRRNPDRKMPNTLRKEAPHDHALIWQRF